MSYNLILAAEQGDSGILFIAAAAVLLVLAILFIFLFLKERRGRSAAEKAAQDKQDTVNREVERVNKESEVKAKEQFIQMRDSLEKETAEVRNELKNTERRLAKREDALDRKVEVMNKKENQIESLEKKLLSRTQKIQEREAELEQVIKEERERLQQLAGLSKEDAEKMLLERIEKELSAEAAALIQKISERTKEESEKVSRHIITTAIQRLAAVHTSETVVSSIDIPNDEMKGRIIGREGRNIRAFEKATGVDVIVDDTPGVVVVSGFDAIRREVARRSMEKLITDGRIHPARIEEVVEQTQKEMEEIIRVTGKQVQDEMDIHDLHPKIANLLGRLKFRTSYGQNALQHSTEVAHLCGMMAGEMGLNVKLAKRCGLLHDIGKAIDHEMEGGHPEIGAGFAQRVRERAEVVNAIASHHEDVPPESLYAVITQAADAISASRPGARRETIDKYIKRLERLEAVATSFEGVRSAYAIQAGREIRVIVDQEKVDDTNALKLARDIAKQIENELSYPGEVKVTLMRETRFIEYAR